MKPVVEVDKLSKLFRLGTIGASSLRESVERAFGRKKTAPTAAVKDSRIANDRMGPEPNTFWGLKDVSFSVQPGEVVGILGRNGAGKSTLLKILSRITEPTSGRAILRGRVVSLLEVGTGFHPELTGRENIFLNGAIMGMKRAEIAAKFDQIVEFSEVSTFLDTPVKRYSSGMYVRLAFAVAAHLEPEILLIDEVLAVGDAGFQKKCLGKMDEVATKHGRTVFFVSHNISAVSALCDNVMLIDNGRFVMRDTPAAVISHYFSSTLPDGKESDGQVVWPDDASAPGNQFASLCGIKLCGPDGIPQNTFEADEPFFVEVHFKARQRLRGARFNLQFSTLEGEIAFVATDHLYQFEVLEPGEYRSTCHIPGKLLNRRKYRVGLHFGIPGDRMLIEQADYLEVTIGGSGNQATIFPDYSWPGVVCPAVEWHVERTPEAALARSAG
ncbi:MAG TPA: ABC transporter ATP-binding protein [Chthoniobacter sp.]|jgi:lipopolysaccharide transport system ATP-binding protein